MSALGGLRTLVILLLALLGTVAVAQTFPALSGRVVDGASLLDATQEAALTVRLEALERASSRQLVVVTLPDLQGYDIADYGYRLGRHWGLGQREARNGAILIVAPTERRVRIEVGYGLEPILTDALSGFIIRDQITPRFRAGDYVGGINAGTDAIIQQLQAPPEAAERRAIEAANQRAQPRFEGSSGGVPTWLFVAVIIGIFVLPMLLGRRGRGRRHSGGWGAPVILWGPGLGGGWGSGGSFSSGGGFSGGGFSGGGFSGGGGSFGGGGASGSW